jgi:hypothetical protein
MDCDEIQRQLQAGTRPGPDANSHLDGCPACTAMLGAAVHLPPPTSAPAGAGDRALLAATMAELERERGAGAWLRERSGATRLAIALTIGLVAPAIVLLASPRADLGVYPRARLVVELALLALAWSLAAAITLRPMHRALTDTTRLGAAAVAVLVTGVLASLPPAHQHGTHELADGVGLVGQTLGCLLFGTLCALPAWLGLRVVAREGGFIGRRASALAAAAVAVGVAGVFLHCPILHRGHLWAGHVTIVVPMLAWAWWHARRCAPAR